MTPEHFRSLYLELMDDNPFTLRAVLKVLEISFTTTVPTLAVTMAERPRLLVNLDFVQEWCQTEREVKALICHEFLHILLRHTEQERPPGKAWHIAQDAVINAIIHRHLGADYSSLMSRFYARATGLAMLLRPPGLGGIRHSMAFSSATNQLMTAWQALYEGRLVADDIASLAASLPPDPQLDAVPLLGGHDENAQAAGSPRRSPAVLTSALDRVLATIDGAGIWRDCAGRGIGSFTLNYRHDHAAVAEQARWRQQTLRILRQHLLPDRHGARARPEPGSCHLQVLSPADRRATLRALWSPFMPEAAWPASHPGARASAQVYLDASGSMHAEMPLIIALLSRLSGHIRRPFWAFSDVVSPARIENSRLVTYSTGDTVFGCVLRHLARTRPAAAVVVTDGHIETLAPELVAAAHGTRLHVIVTAGGATQRLREAGIAFTQLAALPG
ncbi:MAG: hypothetical protein JJT85_00485 [Chromatiales bacterium]|nr:hypothetical protein [Chromatiales bacterium]